MTGRARVILASASTVRGDMLRAAGVAVEQRAVGVDEAGVKAAMQADGASARTVADALAELKAVRGSLRDPEALVVGADQVLALDDDLLDKPEDIGAARALLLQLRGRAHTLISAVVVAEGGKPVWRHVDEARLTVRDFSDAFLDAYLAAEGEAVCGSVGAYQIEGPGAQLFAEVRGDHFTIRGMPLLPLLAFLRNRGVLGS